MTSGLVEAPEQQLGLQDIVDCDVHPAMATPGDIDEYLSPRWREYRAQFGSIHEPLSYPRIVKQAARVDAWPPNGRPPGSDLQFMQEQLLDQWGIGRAVLGPLIAAQQGNRNIDYAAAMSTAVNDWTATEWLSRDQRLLGSVVVPYEDAELAAAEIDRRSADRRFVQIYLQVRTERPLGNRKYWPMYESAVNAGLPVGIHLGGNGGNASTSAGWPSFYLEDHAGFAQAFQAQITSLICEGVFDRFPTLKVVLIEGGFAWLPSLAWRLDRAAQHLSAELPDLARLPSEYIAEHFWFTTQPIEEPEIPDDLKRLIDSFPNLENRLMFSSDYPHWDFDSPGEVLRKIRLSTEVTDKILRRNARMLYGI